MNTETNTPFDSEGQETQSPSTKMSDLQLASSQDEIKLKTPLLSNTEVSKNHIQESSPKSDDGITPSSDSSNNNFQTTQKVTIRKYQSTQPTIDSKAVYHVLNVLGFRGKWIRYLMLDRKLNTYKKLTKLTQELWDEHILYQLPTDLLLVQEDFNRIIVYHNWCNLNLHYNDNDVALAFRFSCEDYDKCYDEQYRYSDESEVDPQQLDSRAFQLIPSNKLLNKQKTPTSDSSVVSKSSHHSNTTNLSNNSFHLLMENDMNMEHGENGEKKNEPNLQLSKQEPKAESDSYKDKLLLKPSKTPSPSAKDKVKFSPEQDTLHKSIHDKHYNGIPKSIVTSSNNSDGLLYSASSRRRNNNTKEIPNVKKEDHANIKNESKGNDTKKTNDDDNSSISSD